MSSEQEARRVSEELQQLGYRPEIRKERDSRFVVYVGRYSSRSEARSVERRLREVGVAAGVESSP